MGSRVESTEANAEACEGALPLQNYNNQFVMLLSLYKDSSAVRCEERTEAIYMMKVEISRLHNVINVCFKGQRTVQDDTQAPNPRRRKYGTVNCQRKSVKLFWKEQILYLQKKFSFITKFEEHQKKGGVRLGKQAELGVFSIAVKMKTKFPEDFAEGYTINRRGPKTEP